MKAPNNVFIKSQECLGLKTKCKFPTIILYLPQNGVKLGRTFCWCQQDRSGLTSDYIEEEDQGLIS